MSIPGSAVMRLANEMTEIVARMADLDEYTKATQHTMSVPEAKLISAQANAMKLYSQVLSARLYLLTGVKP